MHHYDIITTIGTNTADIIIVIRNNISNISNTDNVCNIGNSGNVGNIGSLGFHMWKIRLPFFSYQSLLLATNIPKDTE